MPETPRPRRTVVRVLLALAVLAGAWLASTGWVTWKLTHRARPPYAEPAPKLADAPLEELVLPTSDEQRLGAWLVAFPDAPIAVLLLHGNGGSRTSSLRTLRWLASRKVSVLALTLRAHGDSSGEENDFGWSARRDVLAGTDLLAHRVPAARIVVIGASLGAAAAVYAAKENGDRVAGYVLESPYRDVETATRNRLATALPPFLDRAAFVGMLMWSKVMIEPSPKELSLLDRIADIPSDTPLLLLSGSLDRHAPTAEVEEIRARAGEHARLVRFEGAAHTALHAFDAQRYEAAVLELLAQVEARTR